MDDIKPGETWRTKEGLEIRCVVKEVSTTHVRYLVTSGERPTWCRRREHFLADWERAPTEH